MNYSYHKNISKKDKRQKKWKKQRKNRGFDDTECWSLDITLSEFLVPRLKVFQKNTKSHPCTLSYKEWKKILHKIRIAFEIIKDDMIFSSENPDIPILKNNGLDLFREYINDLWS